MDNPTLDRLKCHYDLLLTFCLDHHELMRIPHDEVLCMRGQTCNL